MKLCDRVIISSDENRKYLDFWPFVAYAYRTIFQVRPVLALVTERPMSDPFFRELEQHGEVFRVPQIEGYPIASQAKMARFLIASGFEDRVCYIDDLDQIPIDKNWHLEKVITRPRGSLLLVGREVYGTSYPDQVPASQMTAEGHVFARLFRTLEFVHEGAALNTWFDYLYSMRVADDDHSNIKLSNFSDEALIVRLRKETPVPEHHVERGYTPGRDTIDRAWWPYSDGRLRAGRYLGAHTARPYQEFKQGNDAIFEYIRIRYDGAPLPQPLS